MYILDRINAKYKKFLERNESEQEYSFKNHTCKICRDLFVPGLCKDVDICPKCEVKSAKTEIPNMFGK
jgi:ribosomal protein L37AE/L43A